MEQLRISYTRFSNDYVGTISKEGYILYENEKYETITKFLSHVLQRQCGMNNLNCVKFSCGYNSLLYHEIAKYAQDYCDIKLCELGGEKKLETIISILAGNMEKICRTIENDRKEYRRGIGKKEHKKTFFSQFFTYYIIFCCRNFTSFTCR